MFNLWFNHSGAHAPCSPFKKAPPEWADSQTLGESQLVEPSSFIHQLLCHNVQAEVSDRVGGNGRGISTTTGDTKTSKSLMVACWSDSMSWMALTATTLVWMAPSYSPFILSSPVNAAFSANNVAVGSKIVFKGWTNVRMC